MHLTAAEWARIETLFPLALELTGPERERFLESECATEPRVRSELDAMLAAAGTEDALFDKQIALTSTEETKTVEVLADGTRLGSWKIKTLIGTGGMGEVYLAERADGAYTMSAAIKLLKRELFSYDNAQRFLRERRVLARLSHPNIARVLDAGTTDDGRPYLVMEYVHGARITDHARARNLSPPDAARLMLAVAEAVAEAHRRGVVHRDLKPANVMVNDEQQVKLLDFGIARLMDEDDAATRVLPMTPAYAAPEQIRGEALTPAADVYALGVMLFQLLTLRLPHSREGMPLPVIAAGLRNEVPERPSRVVLDSEGLFPELERQRRARALAGDLDWITRKALRSDPKRRYANAGEFAEDLRRHFEHRPVSAREESWTQRARQVVERALAARQPVPAAGAGDFKYWGFISYSHQDEAWARWLHTTLETYRVPRRLVGRPLGEETVPRRLLPMFRDRDELASSHELGAIINQVLRQSRNLIVVCSPRSATSRWVNEEIRAFRALGRGSRIFCLIVDGEPHASGKPEIAFTECFAPALREKGIEPIAADARPRKDGKDGAKLKLLAGLLDVGLDELKQREKQRQLRQRVLTTVASLAIFGLLAGSWQWFATQRETREKEILVEKLVENGRLELLDGRQARAAVYLNEALKLGHDTVPLRYMLARAMEPVDALTKVRFLHGGTVLHAAFSPDGKQVAMAVRIKDEVLGKIFDAGTGAEVMQLKQLPLHPRIFQYFADGRRLLVSGFRKVRLANRTEEGPVTGLWSLEKAAPELILDGPVARVGAPLHADGVRFIVPGKSGGVEIWDSVQLKRISVLAAGRPVVACSFSTDGKQIVFADEDGKVEVWDTAAGKLRARLSGAEGLWSVGALFFPDGQQALVATDSGDVRVWDLKRGNLRLAFPADTRTILDATLSANGRRLFTTGQDGHKVWSMARGVFMHSVHRDIAANAAAALSADGNFLYTTDGESPFGELWGLLSKTRLYTLDLHAQQLDYVALDQAGQRLLTASSDGAAEIWSAQIRPRWGMELFTNSFAVRFNNDGKRLLIAGGTDQGAMLQMVSGEAVEILTPGHPAAIRDAKFSHDGKHLLTVSQDGKALWRAADSGVPLVELKQGTQRFQLAQISSDGQRVITAAGNSSFSQTGSSNHAKLESSLWDPHSGTRIAVLAHQDAVYTAAFNPAGTQLATGSIDGVVKLWRSSDGQLLHTWQEHAALVNSVAFSPDGLRLASTSDDKSVRVWDTRSGKRLAMLDDPALGTAYDAVFSPAADRIAIGTQEGVVWLWSPDTGAVQSLKGHTGIVKSVRFLHDGNLLLSSSVDGSIRIWDPRKGAELGKAAASRFEVYSYDVNADATRLATSNGDRFVGSWDIALERRTPETIARRLQCRVPWALRGVQLEPRSISTQGCEAEQ